MKKNPISFAVLLFFVGGILGAFLCKSGLKFFSSAVFTDTLERFHFLSDTTIAYGDLFFLILVRNLKQFLLLWLLCFTMFGIPYLSFTVLRKGFYAGFLMLLLTSTYGIKGILVFLGIYFPQSLLYIPMYLASIREGYALCHDWKEKGSGFSFRDFSLLKGRHTFFILFVFGILLGSLVETFLGSYVLLFVMKIE